MWPHAPGRPAQELPAELTGPNRNDAHPGLELIGAPSAGVVLLDDETSVTQQRDPSTPSQSG